MIAILADGEEQETKLDDDWGGLVGNLGSMFASLVGGGTKDENNVPPRTLMGVISNTGEAVTTTVIRHGELFGAPESLPESSPFMGGP